MKSHGREPHRTGGIASAEAGLVLLDGPDGVAIAMTPDAADAAQVAAQGPGSTGTLWAAAQILRIRSRSASSWPSHRGAQTGANANHPARDLILARVCLCPSPCLAAP